MELIKKSWDDMTETEKVEEYSNSWGITKMSAAVWVRLDFLCQEGVKK